ncbi:MAG: protein kinase [Planctomycetota bacterium]
MPPESARRTKTLFLDAVELDEQERKQFLERLRAESPETCDRVERLLQAHFGDAAEALEKVGGMVDGLLRGQKGQAGGVVGDYELEEEIASGASGVVWRARQRSLGRTVALKVLRAGRLAGSKEVARFHAEAEAVARLDHPNIVPVYEVGQHDGRHFFSMRLLDGSLADRAGAERQWDAREAAEQMIAVARAVHYAHQRGLLHRDLKPSNVLLDTEGTPYVADFGVAKQIDSSGVATMTATIAGTPAYMAPEQTSSEFGELTVSTDVWALGCMLYELLAGRPPFRGESITVLLDRVRRSDPEPMRIVRPDAPHDLETISRRCLAKEPGRRYASANAFATDLQRWLDHEPILARRTSWPERLFLAWRRSPLVASLVVLVGALILAIAIGASWVSVKLSGQLRESYLEQARATRLAGVRGRRSEALDLLSKAAAIRPGADVRDEGIACLALTDLQALWTYPQDRDALNWYGMMSGDLTRVARLRGDAIQVRALPDGETVGELQVDDVNGYALSAGGRLLAARCGREDDLDSARFYAWDVNSGELLLDTDAVVGFTAFDFDPGERFAAVGTMDARVLAWDTRDASEVLAFDVDARLGCVRFAHDGDALALAIGGGVNVLEVRGFPGGELRRRIPLPSAPYSVAWLAGDDGLVVGCANFEGYVFRLSEEGDEPSAVLTGHTAEMVTVFASPTEQLAASNSWDQTMRVWDTETGEELMRISASAAGFSRDGELLGYFTTDEIGAWQVETGSVLRTLHGHRGKSPQSTRFSRDGKLLLTVGGDGAVLWDLASRARIATITSEHLDGAGFLPDGERFFLSGDAGLELRSLDDPTSTQSVLLEGDQDHAGLSPDGGLFAVRDNQLLRIFRPDAPEDALRFRCHRGPSSIAVSRGGAYVAVGSWQGGGASVVDGTTGELIKHLLPERGSIVPTFAPDGSRLALSDGYRYLFYELPGLELVHSIDRKVGIAGTATGLAYSEDGKLVAVTLTHSDVGIYEAETLEPLARLEAPDPVRPGHLCFSPDGTVLAASSTTNRVQIWNLAELRSALAELGLDSD